jgi:iron-sulfur cluster assembly protein
MDLQETASLPGIKESYKPMTSATQSQQRGIQLTDAALRQVQFLRQKQGKDLCLRVGVRQGGCSGMSYLMDFIDPSSTREDDDVFDHEGFQLVCDRKSILYLYGLVLDYSDAMIGGGFQFTNPNANQTCGCGKSFSV